MKYSHFFIGVISFIVLVATFLISLPRMKVEARQSELHETNVVTTTESYHKLFTVTTYYPDGIKKYEHVNEPRAISGNIIGFDYDGKEIDVVGIPVKVEEE